MECEKEKKIDLSKVLFSKNDLKSNIRVPEYLDTNLAYLLGIQVGDGYLKKTVRTGKVDYLMSYDGNLLNEFDWYNTILRRLFKDLFNKEVKVRKTTTGTVKIYFRSKGIFTFLHEVCGISQSPKTNIGIPDIITNSSLEIKRAFLRGLADTDFSLNFKTRKGIDYPVIDFHTSCKTLHELIILLLKELGFKFHAGNAFKKRLDKEHIVYYVYISGRHQLDKWMNDVGFGSFNHITRYDVWKKLGYLPSKTNITQRYELLKMNAPGRI